MAQLLDIRSSDMGPRDFLVKWADGEEDSWVRPASWSPSLDAFSAAVKAGMHEALASLTRPSLPPTTPHQAAASADDQTICTAGPCGSPSERTCIMAGRLLHVHERQCPIRPIPPPAHPSSRGRAGQNRLLAGEGD